MRKSILSPLFAPLTLQLMTIFFLKTDEWLYLSDIAKRLKKTPSSLQRDLKALLEAELLETRKDSNRVYYRANKHNPILKELQSILIKTVGIREVVADSLKPYIKNIELSFIYGSLARSEEVATSDVDLMIVGELSLQELSSSILKAERLLGREINPTIFSPAEFRKRVNEESSFLRTVLADKKIFLKGTEDELQTLAG